MIWDTNNTTVFTTGLFVINNPQNIKSPISIIIKIIGTFKSEGIADNLFTPLHFLNG